jgi:hypothetical protein
MSTRSCFFKKQISQKKFTYTTQSIILDIILIFLELGIVTFAKHTCSLRYL